ncbi:hypothetical protein RJ639_044689 [Escallonia herrerae]|uniref:ADP-ribosyl cyclase/cyclic ADP-ribose hydrolase n=1 Tax=Escallonia herrerae TaxID=1293975 RepID=A0AA88WF02_9ASTE|nr:hypothetical protein RJ639_044689 [Escallonia herrerae]
MRTTIIIDIRQKFTCLLRDALVRSGFSTFMDEEDIHTGEKIDTRIREGIKNSRSAIIVFSENYASSTWCLQELVLILERLRISAYDLIPIYYYGVEPQDIKHQKKEYGKALVKHKTRYEQEVESWKAALKKVGNFKGIIVEG